MQVCACLLSSSQCSPHSGRPGRSETLEPLGCHRECVHAASALRCHQGRATRVSFETGRHARVSAHREPASMTSGMCDVSTYCGWLGVSPSPHASCDCRASSTLLIEEPPQAATRLQKPLGRDKRHRLSIGLDRPRTHTESGRARPVPTSRRLAPSLLGEPNGLGASPITFCSWETTRRCTNGLAGETPLIA